MKFVRDFLDKEKAKKILFIYKTETRTNRNVYKSILTEKQTKKYEKKI